MNIFKFIFIAMLSINAFTLELTSESETSSLCSNAANKFATNKITESFNSLKPYWPLPANELDNLSYQTKSQLQMVSSRFGRSLSADFIGTQKAGDSFIKHTYAIKFEKHAIRYMCIFYKPKNKWVVNSVVWDDKVDELFHH